VVILEVRQQPPLPTELQSLFFKLVNAGFRQKRKQVANSIADVLQLPKAGIADWLSASDINPMRRAETLSVDDWVTITRSAPPDVVAA
jgi:16S rRNA (adenine1518-N6/adenine1519-N6)-dimethyltransferase